MLVLTLKVDGDPIYIGNDITVHVTHVKGNQVSLGITAPKNIVIDRKKIRDSKNKERNK